MANRGMTHYGVRSGWPDLELGPPAGVEDMNWGWFVAALMSLGYELVSVSRSVSIEPRFRFKLVALGACFASRRSDRDLGPLREWLTGDHRIGDSFLARGWLIMALREDSRENGGGADVEK